MDSSAITTTDSPAMLLLTPVRWSEARSVLCGETNEGVSWAAAARAAGVSVVVLRQWVKRSAERRAEDEPWIHEIAEIVGMIDELQAGRLEDHAWDHVLSGVDEPVFQGGEKVGHKTKYDHKLLMDMLRARDPRYQTKPTTVINQLIADPHEVFLRLKAARRMREIQETGA